jgi:Ca2+-binding EF-hand superfamily protein
MLSKKLCTRGASGFIGLRRNFKIQDDNGSGTLEMSEFTKAMREYKLGFTDQEICDLFNYFDVDRSGNIDFDEFIVAIRGDMNPAREAIVMQAFNKLDKDKGGWIDVNDIRGTYNARKHPDVLQGKKTEDQILKEFLVTFE